MLNLFFFRFDMNIVERLTELLPPSSTRSSAIEYGSAPESNHGNTLFDFEINNWKVLCMHPDKGCCDEVRIFRRLVINKDCSENGNFTLNEIISNINVEEVKILLIKNTQEKDILHIINGLDLIERKTQIVCIQQKETSRREIETYLKGKGFRFLERVLVSDIFLKDEEYCQDASLIENIFRV